MCAQFVWGKYQALLKKSLHHKGARITNPVIALNGTKSQLREREAARVALGADAAWQTNEESFTGGVPKTIRGGRRYWREAFIQVMAMAGEYGVPQFFLTLTLNEGGWRDVRT